MTYMTFGDAIEFLKAGDKVTRKGWNGKGMWLAMQTPDEHSKMTLPYIYMKTADDNLVPWVASQTDILSEDWELVEELDTSELVMQYLKDMTFTDTVRDTERICPNCGHTLAVGINVTFPRDDNGAQRTKGPRTVYYTKCCGCGLQGPSSSTYEGVWEKMEESYGEEGQDE